MRPCSCSGIRALYGGGRKPRLGNEGRSPLTLKYPIAACTERRSRDVTVIQPPRELRCHCSVRSFSPSEGTTMLNVILLTAGTWTAISLLFVWRLATAIPKTRHTARRHFSVLHARSRHPSAPCTRARAPLPSHQEPGRLFLVRVICNCQAPTRLRKPLAPASPW